MANVSGGLSFSGGFTFIPAPTVNGPFIAFQDTTDTIAVYTWSGSGFGTKFSNPVGMPVWRGGIAFNPTNSAIAYVSSTSPYVHAYALTNSGFGAKYNNPSALNTASWVARARVTAFNKAGNALAMVGAGGNKIHIFRWNDSTGFGTKYNTPVDYAQSNTHQSIDFHPSDTAFITTYASSFSSGKDINAYPWNNTTGAGTKFSNPTETLGEAYQADFHPNGNDVAIASGNSPFIYVYAWSSSTGFGAKYGNPAVGTGGAVFGGVQFSKSGNSIIMGGNTTARLSAYPWTSGTGFGTKFSNPSGFNPGGQNEFSFSADGTAVAIAHNNSPYVSVFAWSDSTGFGAKFSDPTTLPVATGAVRFSN